MMEFLNNRILIIDDNEAIHLDFKKALTSNDHEENSDIAELEHSLSGEKNETIKFPVFELHSAYQGESSIELIQEARNKGRPYALAFVDIRMPPGWDGVETIENIWKVDPDIQTVICTAYSDYSWEELFKRIGHSDRLLLLKKPFEIIEIRLFALTLTKKWTLNQQANLKMEELQRLVDKKTEELKLSYTLIKATLESTADGIIAVDRNNNIINYNRKFMEIWDIPKTMLENHQARIIAEAMRSQLKNLDEPILDTQKIISENYFGHYREIELKSKRPIQYLEQFIQPHYHEGKIEGIVYSFRDVTARKFLEEELIKQATYDRLTGLPNRALFIDRIRQAIIYAKRNNLFVAVLFADLDSFKYVNDSLGHDVGDELLKLFAQRLQQALRKSDSIVRLQSDVEVGTAARFGGDEFVILLMMNSAEVNDITAIIDRLYVILIEPYQLQNRDLTVTASIGVSIYPQDGDNPITLIKNADNAMYRAKNKGKGTFEFFKNEMSTESVVHLEVENNLRQAMENHELFLHYQPLIDVQTKKIVSLEVLMRWKHPTLGIIAPTIFIPIAEESNLIIPIGTWVLKTACAQNKAWQDSGLPKITISVNVSGHQFKQDNFPEVVKEALEETGLEGQYLELELTESALFLDVNEILYKLQRLKDLGVHINLDDFGTGYSSLSYINQFPIDKLKIDQSFIKTLSQNPESKTIIQAVMMIAKTFNMKVVAEGVETADQLDILGELETDEVQGFYLSKPMSVKDTTELLKNHWGWPIKS